MPNAAGPRYLHAALTGLVVAVIAGALAGVLLAVVNPLFFDRLLPGIASFVVFPSIAGALVGLLLAAVTRRPVGRGRGSGPRALRVALGAVALATVVVFILDFAAARHEARPSQLLKTLIIGVDGATWDVIRPLQERGELTELARLESEGVSATCITLVPIFSNRIFTSIATGKVAEKHGVIGVSETAENLKSARVWDVLGARGWKTGTFEWYVTWPPEARTSGFTVPDIYARSSATSPEGLRFLRELRIGAKAGRDMGPRQGARYAKALVSHGVRLSTLVEMAMFAARARLANLPPEETYYRQHYLWVKVETDVFCRLIETYDLDFGAIIYKVTDSLGHKYWKYHDPSHFPGVSAEDVHRYGDVINGSYRLVDEGIGRIVRRVGPGGVVAVISDHGFGPAPASETGISTLRTGAMLKLLGLEKTGWEYVNIGGAASLMLKSAATEAAHSDSLHAIAARFEQARIAGSDQPVFIVEKQDRPGMGDDCVEVGIQPAVVARIAEDLAVDFGGGTSAHLHDLVVTSDLSGDHTLDGILILRGAGVRKGVRLPDCSVLDLAPTLFALRGMPVGADMDGRVLEAWIEPAWLSEHPVATIASYDTQENLPRLTPQPETEIPPDVLEKLRSLGYIQ